MTKKTYFKGKKKSVKPKKYVFAGFDESTMDNTQLLNAIYNPNYYGNQQPIDTTATKENITQNVQLGQTAALNIQGAQQSTADAMARLQQVKTDAETAEKQQLSEMNEASKKQAVTSAGTSLVTGLGEIGKKFVTPAAAKATTTIAGTSIPKTMVIPGGKFGVNKTLQLTGTQAGKKLGEEAGKQGLKSALGSTTWANPAAGNVAAGIGLAASIGGTLWDNLSEDDDPYTYNKKEQWGDWGGNILSEVGTYGGLGSMFGPLGTVVGGVAGLGVGIYKASKESKENKKRAQEMSAERDRQQAEYRRLMDEYQSNLDKQQRVYDYNKAKIQENIVMGEEQLRQNRLQSLTESQLSGNTSIAMTGGGRKYFGKGGVSVPGGQVVPIGQGAVEFVGRKHSQGGIKLDAKTEVEGGETMDKVKMKNGKMNDYFFSEFLKYKGKSFAKRHKELVKKGASQKEIQALAKKQEAMANRRGEKDRSPKQVAEYGGLRKYQTAGEKETLTYSGKTYTAVPSLDENGNPIEKTLSVNPAELTGDKKYIWAGTDRTNKDFSQTVRYAGDTPGAAVPWEPMVVNENPYSEHSIARHALMNNSEEAYQRALSKENAIEAGIKPATTVSGVQTADAVKEADGIFRVRDAEGNILAESSDKNVAEKRAQNAVIAAATASTPQEKTPVVTAANAPTIPTVPIISSGVKTNPATNTNVEEEPNRNATSPNEGQYAGAGLLSKLFPGLKINSGPSKKDSEKAFEKKVEENVARYNKQKELEREMLAKYARIGEQKTKELEDEKRRKEREDAKAARIAKREERRSKTDEQVTDEEKSKYPPMYTEQQLRNARILAGVGFGSQLIAPVASLFMKPKLVDTPGTITPQLLDASIAAKSVPQMISAGTVTAPRLGRIAPQTEDILNRSAATKQFMANMGDPASMVGMIASDVRANEAERKEMQRAQEINTELASKEGMLKFEASKANVASSLEAQRANQAAVSEAQSRYLNVLSQNQNAQNQAYIANLDNQTRVALANAQLRADKQNRDIAAMSTFGSNIAGGVGDLFSYSIEDAKARANSGDTGVYENNFLNIFGTEPKKTGGVKKKMYGGTNSYTSRLGDLKFKRALKAK